jgi:hypothetical protein
MTNLYIREKLMELREEELKRELHQRSTVQKAKEFTATESKTKMKKRFGLLLILFVLLSFIFLVFFVQPEPEVK